MTHKKLFCLYREEGLLPHLLGNRLLSVSAQQPGGAIFKPTRTKHPELLRPFIGTDRLPCRVEKLQFLGCKI